MRFDKRSTDFGSVTNRYCERKLLTQLQRPAISKTSCAISSRWSERNVWRKFTKYKRESAQATFPERLDEFKFCAIGGGKSFPQPPKDFPPGVGWKPGLASPPQLEPGAAAPAIGANPGPQKPRARPSY